MIPEDWEVKPLGELASLIEYGSSAKSVQAGLVPVLRMGNLQDGKIDWSNLVYTSDSNEIDKYLLCNNDILFNRTNTIDLVGKAAIYRSEFPAIFAGYLIRVQVNQEKYSADYINYILNTSLARIFSLKVLSQAIGQANINGEKLKTYPIPIPPTLSEQSRIVEALRDIDTLIESIDQLIAKKRNIKQAAMRQLLTGKKRLPGFHEKWELKELGHAGHCLRGVSYHGDSDLSANDTAYTKRLLRSNNIQDAVVVNAEVQYVNAEQVSPTQILKQNDILICMANGSKALVGKAGRFGIVDGYDYTFGAFMGCFRIDTSIANPIFVFYLFQTKQYRDYINNILTGSSINNLRPSSIESLEFLIPSLPEQTAIATLLSELDEELEILQARRDKTKHLKQAMMQELLTGRIRLI